MTVFLFYFLKSIGEELKRQFQNSSFFAVVVSVAAFSQVTSTKNPPRKSTMRGRFLNIDYFSTPPSQVYEALGFLNLPAPDDFPAPLFRDPREEFLRFEPIEGFSLPIDNLPIGDALSKFLSDVVPDRVTVDYGAFEMDYSSLGDELRFVLGRGDPQFLEVRFRIPRLFVSGIDLES